MESGSELSKTVATFILQKILQDETGLYYICQTYDRSVQSTDNNHLDFLIFGYNNVIIWFGPIFFIVVE